MRNKWFRSRFWAGAGLVAVVSYAVLVPVLVPGHYLEADLSQARLAPGALHWFGTDSAGHDLFVRVALGLRVSLVVAGCCAVISTVLGVGIGALSAVWGGKVDAVLMRVTDAVNALPQLLLGIAIVAFYPGSLVAIVASIALVHWCPVARVVRSISLSTREMEYVDAAYLSGASRWQVLHRHLLPAVAGQMKVSVALLFPHAIWHESTLSFLGLGISPDRPSLGTLLEIARSEVLIGCWWSLVFPAGALVGLSLLIFWWAGSWQRGAQLPNYLRPTPAKTAPGKDSAAGEPRRGNPTKASGATDVEGEPRAGVDSHGATDVGDGPRAGVDSHGATEARQAALEFRDLDVEIATPGAPRAGVAVETGVDLRVYPGELHALLGESGAGKSMLANVATGMLPAGTRLRGRVEVAGRRLYAQDCAWGEVRGRLVAVAAQSSATSLAPNLSVGAQLLWALRELRSDLVGESRAALNEEVARLCALVGFPELALEAYPHELSGGMLTRAGLALALAGEPAVLIADEVTAGLDPQLSRLIWGVLRDLADRGLAVLAITHDWAALVDGTADGAMDGDGAVDGAGDRAVDGDGDGAVADTVSVIRQGRILEQGLAREVLGNPGHDYTRRMLAALPRHNTGPAGLDEDTHTAQPSSTTHATGLDSSPSRPYETVLEVRNLSVGYQGRAVISGVNLALQAGRTVGLRGASGLGKTTVARAIAGLISPLDGQILGGGDGVEMLFQSPRRSVNPLWKLEDVLAEPLVYAGVSAPLRREQVREICAELGIAAVHLQRFGREVSEGELQKVALGRCLLARPRVLISDEATAMLDPLSAATLVGAMQRRTKDGLAVLAISHDTELLESWTDTVVDLQRK